MFFLQVRDYLNQRTHYLTKITSANVETMEARFRELSGWQTPKSYHFASLTISFRPIIMQYICAEGCEAACSVRDFLSTLVTSLESVRYLVWDHSITWQSEVSSSSKLVKGRLQNAIAHFANRPYRTVRCYARQPGD